MNILRNFDKFRKGIELDLENFKIKEHSGELESTTKTIGTYAKCANRIVGLFKNSNNKFSIFIDENFYKIDSDFNIEFDKKEKTSILTIKTGNGDSYKLEYINDLEPISTLTYTEEDEDVDFGLWLFNILNSKDRISILNKTNEKYKPVNKK